MTDQEKGDSWAERAQASNYRRFSSKAQFEVIEQMSDRDLMRFMVLQNLEMQHELRRIRKLVFFIALPLIVSVVITVTWLILGGILLGIG